MKATTLDDYTQRMLRVLSFIQQHLDEPTSLETLAEVAAFSPFHFHRVFRGMVGESVKEYIRRLRLDRAAVRLKVGTQAITEIAFEAGYESHEAFTRAFKANRGLTPSEFRAQSGVQSDASQRQSVSFRADGSIEHFAPLGLQGGAMSVKIMKRDPQRIAFVRHVGPYDQCGAAWERLVAGLGKEGLLGTDAQFIGLCHDDPEVTPTDKIRYDACCTVDDTFVPRGDVGVTVIEGGDFAMTTHVGPFEQLNETYAKLFGQWLPRSGRELRPFPCLEVYLTDPENTDPEDYVTDIYAPLEPV